MTKAKQILLKAARKLRQKAVSKRYEADRLDAEAVELEKEAEGSSHD